MKRTSSVHLEEDIWDRIEKYKAEHGLTSRNDAIERIVLEVCLGNNKRINIKSDVDPGTQEKSILDKAMESAYSDMAD